MSTIALNRTNHKSFAKADERMTLSERFRNYLAENSAVIVSGMMALNGDSNAYKIYNLLKK